MAASHGELEMSSSRSAQRIFLSLPPLVLRDRPPCFPTIACRGDVASKRKRSYRCSMVAYGLDAAKRSEHLSSDI